MATSPSNQTQAFNLQSFAAELGQHGIAKPYLFSVIIHPPEFLLAKNFLSQPMTLRIETASLPRRSYMTHDQRYYGPERRIPYAVQFTPMNIEVILSEDMREREFFMLWQDAFLSGGSGSASARLSLNTAAVQSPYDSSYYDEINGTVEILQYCESPSYQGATVTGNGSDLSLDTIIGTAQAVGINTSAITNPFGIDLGIGKAAARTPKPSYKITLDEAYPISVGEVPLSWSNDGIAKLNVEIQFRELFEFHNTSIDVKNQMGLAALVREGMNTLNRFRPALSVVSNLGVGGAIRAAGSQAGSSVLPRGTFNF